MARHRPRSEWFQLVQAHRHSGLGVTDFARQHGLEVASLRRWRAEFATADQVDIAPGFVEVTLPVQTPPVTMTLEVGGARLALSGAPDPRWLAALLQALAVPSC